MRSQNTLKDIVLNSIKINIVSAALVVAPIAALAGSTSWAQSAQYKRHYARKKSAAKPAGKGASSSAPSQNDKLNISDLEQKYWAPKDTDFSVVQNRTYTKAKRFATSLLIGPIVNDPYNTGYNYELKLNYYFDERYGAELFYDQADLHDSQTTKDFANFGGGGVRPDFDRDENFIGAGFNWVPFYAKMSFLGKKIIYFDMQITPFIGLEKYQQLVLGETNPTKTSFSYGFDVVQYFFFSKHFAAQADLQNRYYKQDVLCYSTTALCNAGQVKRSNESSNTTNFLLGVTYFY